MTKGPVLVLSFVLSALILLSGCVIGTEPVNETNRTSVEGPKIVMFHNGRGHMCKDAEAFFESINYPVEEHLTDESGFREQLTELVSQYESSEGVSDSFSYYPIIFVDGKAYSGFNEQVKNSILSDINKD